MDFSGKVVTAKQLTGKNLNTSRNAPYGIQGKAYLNAVFSDGTIHTAATFSLIVVHTVMDLHLTTPMKRLVLCQQMSLEC